MSEVPNTQPPTRALRLGGDQGAESRQLLVSNWLSSKGQPADAGGRKRKRNVLESPQPPATKRSRTVEVGQVNPPTKNKTHPHDLARDTTGAKRVTSKPRRRKEGGLPEQAQRAGAEVARSLCHRMAVTTETLTNMCKDAWTRHRAGNTDPKAAHHVNMAAAAATNLLQWYNIPVTETLREARPTRPLIPARLCTPSLDRALEESKVVLWDRPLRTHSSVWQWARDIGVAELDLQVARVVHGEHPRQELVFANQHLRDQALSIIRREDHTAIEWARAGRSYRQRLASRQQPLEPNDSGTRRARSRNRGARPRQESGESIPLHNYYTPLAERPHRELTVLSNNVRGLQARTAEITMQRWFPKPDILLFQETWLKKGARAPISGYTAFHSYHPSPCARGEGGVSVYVCSAICAQRCPTHGDRPDILWVRMQPQDGPPIFICSAYGPQESASIETAREFFETLRSQAIEFGERGQVIIAGDLNAKLGPRGDRTGGVTDVDTSRNGELLYQTLVEANLWCLTNRSQESARPTYRNGNYEAVLDYVLVSEGLWEQGSKCRTSDNHDTGSDHIPVLTFLPYVPAPSPPPRAPSAPRWKIKELRKADKRNRYEELLKERAKGADEKTSVEEVWTQWKDTVRGALQSSIGSSKRSRKAVAWWSPALQEAVVKRNRARRDFEKSGSQAEWDKYTEQRRLTNEAIRETKLAHHRKMCEEANNSYTTDPKRFWNMASRMQPGARAGGAQFSVRRCDGALASTAEEALEAWRVYYHSLGNDDTPTTPYQPNEEHRREIEAEVAELAQMASALTQADFSMTVDITEAEVSQALQHTKNGRAAGAGNFPAECLKGGGETMVKLLTKLFNKCWSQGLTPLEWKEGVICPILKQGDPTLPNNYRGITVLCSVGKLYCKVLLNRVASWAENHLPREQAGFRPNRACEDDTIILNEVLARARADKKEVYVAFVDLRKAYDTVWRKGLWYKLHRLGLPHKLICTFQELYSQCPNRVLVQGVATDPFDILLGLKQGCVLSPTLFNLYISDLPTHIRQSCLGFEISSGCRVSSLFFADDFAIIASSVEELQATLSALHSYCNTWRLQVSISKTKVMYVGGESTPPNVTYAGEPLENVSSFEYLGVVFQSNGKWDIAATAALASAKKRAAGLYYILRNRNLSVQLRARVAKSVIQPILEYGTEVIDPPNIGKYESVMTQAGCVILGANRHSAAAAVRGDLGLVSIESSIAKKRASAWHKMVDTPNDLLHAVSEAAEEYRPIAGGMRDKVWVLKDNWLGSRRNLRTPKNNEGWLSRAGAQIDHVDAWNWKARCKELGSLRLYRTLPHRHGIAAEYTKLPPKLASLCFKIRSRTLPVNRFLHRLQPSTPSTCRACQENTEETLEHCIWDCPQDSRADTAAAVGALRQAITDIAAANRIKPADAIQGTGSTEVSLQVMTQVSEIWKGRVMATYPPPPPTAPTTTTATPHTPTRASDCSDAIRAEAFLRNLFWEARNVSPRAEAPRAHGTATAFD